LITTGIETLNISAETAGSNTSTLVNTAMTASTINVTKGVATNTVALGTLNKATTSVLAGTSKSKLTMTGAAGVGMTVTAAGAVVQTATTSTKADNVTLTGDIGAVIHVINGGATATAAASDTLSARINNAATDFTSVSGFEVLNLTVKSATATGFNNGTKNDGLETASIVNILGGNANSSFTVDATGAFNTDKVAATAQSIDASTFAGAINLSFGEDDFDIFTTVKGGSATTDAVSAIIAAPASTTAGNNPTMTGVEKLTVTSNDGDVDAVISLANVTGLTSVTANIADATGADQIEIDSMPNGVPINVVSANTGDILDIGLASTAGAADALSLVMVGNTGTLNLDAAGIETLNLVAFTAGGTIDLAGVAPTLGSATTVNLSGGSNYTLNAINAGITTINAASLAGTLTVDAAQRGSGAMTITGGVNNDVIEMENASDVLTGGTQATAGRDKLSVTYAAVVGAITIDLTAADQVVSMDGGTNTAVQSGFEDLDLSGHTGYGAIVTGTAGVNAITGTASTDRIDAGKGNDVITETNGNDQVTLGAGTDSYTLTAARMANNSATTATLAGGSGTDTIIITGGATILLDADFRGISTMDTLTTTAGNHTFITGAKFAASGIKNITFGAGNMNFEAELLTGSAAAPIMLTGFTLNQAADVLDLGGTAATGDWTSTGWTITNGVYTKAGATVADFYAAAAADSDTAGEVAAFTNGGNTYIFGEGGNTNATDDSYVGLIGVVVTSVSATHNTAALHIE
jgi:hypothetical protein